MVFSGGICIGSARGTEQTQKSPENPKIRADGGAKSGAVTPSDGATDAQLVQLSILWKHLPVRTRTALLSLAESSAEGSSSQK